MISIAKEEDFPCGKEGDKNITSCTDDIKNLQITCTDVDMYVPTVEKKGVKLPAIL